MAQLGFIGLGKMGGRVAKRLLDAGHTVTGYNRTKSKAQWLLDAGMQWGASPRQVAETADVTFSMVTNTAALHEVLNGDDGILAGLAPGKIYIDMSTISVSTSCEIAGQVSAKGAHMLDAPVSGNVIHVEEGTISMIVGGNQAIFEKVKSILQDITTKVSYVGGNGQALLMKIAINLSLPVQFLGFCEGILLAEKNGIPRQISRHSVSRSIGPTWQKNWMLRVPEGSCHEQSSRQVMYPFNTSRDVWSVTGDPGSEHVGQGKGNYMPQTSTKKRFWTDNSFNQFSASCWLVPVFS